MRASAKIRSVFAGVIVPVAHLAPVIIGGVSIRRATLHNTEYVTSRDLRIGDWVLVERRGDVIPKVQPFSIPLGPHECSCRGSIVYQ